MDERIVCYIDEIEVEVEEIKYRGEPEIITEDGNEYRLFQCYEDAYDGVEYEFESEHEELSDYTLAYRTN